MPRACIAAVMLVLSVEAAPSSAPGSLETYRDAVSQYQAGDVAGAARLVAGWSAKDFRDAMTRFAEQASAWKRIEAAAMLHTELILAEVVSDDAGIGMHLALAEALVARLTPARALPSAPRDEIARFQEQWYELGASIDLAMTAPEQASDVVDRGLRLFKDSARLRMYHGIVEEMRAHLADGNLHDAVTIRTMPPGAGRRRLLLAEDAYRAALRLDPMLAEARLRLGRVLTLRQEPKAARRELEEAQATAFDPWVQQLARLFLGALSEYEHDLSAARDHYASALTLFPADQTALVALSYVEAMSGHEADARTRVAGIGLADRFAAPELWHEYANGGISHQAYAWLHAQVQPQAQK